MIEEDRRTINRTT